MSEFGKGLCYNLGLFLCHSERDYLRESPLQEPRLWFYSASDHLFDVQTNSIQNDRLKQRILTFVDKCMAWRLPMGENEAPNEGDKTWAINEAKTLLRLIDEYHGIKTEKGDYE